MRSGSRPPDSPRAFRPAHRWRADGAAAAVRLGLGIYLIRPLPGVTVSAGGADRRQLHQRQLGHRGVHRRRRLHLVSQGPARIPSQARHVVMVGTTRASG
jgi:hypothetical protein